MTLILDQAVAEAPADFDFFIGRWTVAHSRLDARLAGCSAWTAFDGVCETRKILGGLGNIDDNVLNLPSGAYRAATVRMFDVAAGQWSIWWLDARSSAIEPPVSGGFQDGVGLFFGDDVFEGRPIRVRFTWSDITPDSCCWAQAFSEDGGETWETNWRMRFSRAA